jgi:hypothetical protein
VGDVAENCAVEIVVQEVVSRSARDVLSVVGPVKRAVAHKGVQDRAARWQSDAEQTCRLAQVQTQTRHLAIHADDHRDEFGPGRLAIGRSTNLMTPFFEF